MKITPAIANAFSRGASPGIRLEKIEDAGHETRFVAFVPRLGRSITVGCSGILTPAEAAREAYRIGAYLSNMAEKRMGLAHVDR